MRIAVIGTGAMGSVYAGLLAAHGGHELWAIDTCREHVVAIQRGGLRVEGASGDRTVPMRASVDAADAGPCDLVILATKAAQTADAARAALPILKADTPVVTIQNGLGSADRVAAVVGPERIIIGVVGGFGASLKGPGHAHHNGMEFLRLGEMIAGPSERLERVAQIWCSGGFKVLTFADIHKMIWEKLICNVSYSGPCTLTGWTVGEVQASADAWAVSAACASEAYAVARAKNIDLDFIDPVAYVRAFGAKIPQARPSMLQDHLARRPSEIDVINGAIAPLAVHLGMSAPVNATVTALVKARESAFA